jgi:hypothetical protein
VPVILSLLFPLVINEVCYDPDGPDGGAEFVELWNAGSVPVVLTGVTLKFANGADSPPEWSVRWRAADTLVVAPGAPLLVADEGWQGPPPAAVASLGLQNGPDALRLVGPAGELDRVGWGDLDWPELSEGDPAEDVSGQSLARRPDGHDTDDNAVDWRAATPTPGVANWRSFAPEITEAWLWPPSSRYPDASITIVLTIVNGGLETLLAARALVTIGLRSETIALPPLPPETTAEVTAQVAVGGQGRQSVVVQIVGTGPADTTTQVIGTHQVGLPDVRLSEVMAAPAAGGEWCEIVNTGSVPRSLSGLQLRDEDGAWRELPALDLAPGDCQLVAQDAGELERWLDELAAAGAAAGCQPRPVTECTSWPGLNNTAPDHRTFADCLRLGDADGHVLDHVVLGEQSGEAPTGRSLERTGAGAWRLATAVAGATPGCAPPPAPPLLDGDLMVAPNPFRRDAGDGAVRLSFRVPVGADGWELRILDLWGQPVFDGGGDELGAGPRELHWDGRDDAGRTVPPGAYVALLRWRHRDGGVTAAHRRVIVVADPQ